MAIDRHWNQTIKSDDFEHIKTIDTILLSKSRHHDFTLYPDPSSKTERDIKSACRT